MNHEEIKFLKLIGNRIKYIRLSQNISIESLALMSKLSVQLLSDVEDGKIDITIDLFYRIAKALNTTPDEFLKF